MGLRADGQGEIRRLRRAHRRADETAGEGARRGAGRLDGAGEAARLSARIFVGAARPRTLSAAIVPVLVGSAIAQSHGTFRIDVFVVALAASLLIQIGADYANDVSEYLPGADTAERLGPPRATAQRPGPRAA